MTPHEHKYINDNRGVTTQDHANALLSIAKLFNGPKKSGCFCKSVNITNYINTFYAWYDANYPTTNE